MRVIKRTLVTICLAMVCAACGNERPAIQKPPVDLLTCKDEPEAPDLPGRELQAQRDAMTFDYILAMRSSWGDCRGKLQGVKAWADSLNN